MTTHRKTYRLRTPVHHSLRDRPLIDFLVVRFPYLTRELWETRILTGRVIVNGAPADPGDIVRRNDIVEYELTVDEPDVDFSYDAVYEDQHLFVVSKSGNIPVHASGQFIGNTLISSLRSERGDALALSHRLDRETSGLIITTKTLQARRAMSAAFEEGRIRKTYLAVVLGVPEADSFTVDVPLRKIGKQHPVPRSVADLRRGRPARTNVCVLERFSHAALLKVDPLTGRTNQIRAHLELAGHPVVGDKSYGVPASLIRDILERPDSEPVRRHLLIGRHALHATRLRFAHPVAGVSLDLSAALPRDLALLIHRLRKETSKLPQPNGA